jgi:predicted metal-binding membrane protein
MGCCWTLMLLAFVGGAMNLGWMVLLTLFVTLEKLIGAHAMFLRLSALALLLAGAAEMSRSMI